MLRSIFRFGQLSLDRVFIILFSVGSMLIVYRGVLFSRAVYLGNTLMKEIEHFDGTWYTYTYEEVNNLGLALIAFATYTILLIIFWRIVCELLYIIFDRIKATGQPND